MKLTDDKSAVRMMRFRPEYGGLTYTLQVRIEALDFILRLRFCQVRVMHSHNILDFRVDCEGHLS